jgi:RNA polymerase sigma factor (TIGR02999 family)
MGDAGRVSAALRTMCSPKQPITELLDRWRGGDAEAGNQLLPLIYHELRILARRYLRSERKGHTLQPTEVVHEAWLRLAEPDGIQWQNRAHFYGIAAAVIRNMLVVYARARRAAKRGGDALRVSLTEAQDVAGRADLDLVALDDALARLAQHDARLHRIVELRFFGGLSVEETAEVMRVSGSTVKRQWILAKTWIFREMSGA